MSTAPAAASACGGGSGGLWRFARVDFGVSFELVGTTSWYQQVSRCQLALRWGVRKGLNRAGQGSARFNGI